MKGLLAVAAGVVLLVGGCTGQEPRPGEGTAPAAARARSAGEERPHAHHAAPDIGADAPLDGMSIYQLGSTWTDQHGASRTLTELRGRPQVIAMVYTHCGSACPRIVLDMKRLEARYPDVGLVLVSIDPERDTPGRLSEFAEGSDLGENWTLLRGEDDDVLELATVLGVRFRRIAPGEFMHSNIMTVLDAEGRVAYRQEALGEVAGTLDALGELLAERP